MLEVTGMSRDCPKCGSDDTFANWTGVFLGAKQAQKTGKVSKKSEIFWECEDCDYKWQ